MSDTIKTSGEFYTKYKSIRSNYSLDTFLCAERTLHSLVTKVTSADKPGMLLGKVQSGKTRTFISILALSFDNNYDIAIIFSKNSKALLEQTFKRLSSEFHYFREDNKVNIYDIMNCPDEFGIYELETKLIFVLKKETNNLKRLSEIFKNNPLMARRNTIIVDDEADSASVGYAKRSEMIEANKIAAQISDFRSLLQTASFLQVTATPYSLYLQPTEIEVENVFEFKPLRPTFTELVPVPDSYVGGDTYFGESSRAEEDTLESLIHHTVDHEEFERLKSHDSRVFKIGDVLNTKKIEGYRTAVINFLAGGSMLRLLGRANGQAEGRLRYSLLVHTEQGIAAHRWQERLTREICKALRDAALTNDPKFTDLVTASIIDLEKSIALAGQTPPNRQEVIGLVRDALTMDQVATNIVNSENNVAALLDDTGQLTLRRPFNIFLGGQVLDRGITVGNMIGFYYGRRPRKFQQDTVLQHSRMFGYRRPLLLVTRFYTSRPIRHTMARMEEFDASLRERIASGGDGAIQFIRKSDDGTIIPCSPNRILVARTQTLKPLRRVLPIGFQTFTRTGRNGIGEIVEGLDLRLEALIPFNAEAPRLISLVVALALLDEVEKTMEFPEADSPPWNWADARAILQHLSNQSSSPSDRGKVWLWTAWGRNSKRLAGKDSHATYIETPDSERTEGPIARSHAINVPILFMLRQNGETERGWKGTPFYWPVIRAQVNTRTAVFTSEVLDVSRDSEDEKDESE